LKPTSTGLPIAALALALAAACPGNAGAEVGPVVLPDSTVIENWALPNGLRVVTRHIPRCGAVSITLAYPFGSADDPPGREGLAALLAELAYTAGTSDAPERTRGEMFDLRPAGWNLLVSPHVTQLSELAAVEQFPGVLHQVAVRMRGVNVTPAGLRTSLSTVRADLDTNYRVAGGRVLYYGTREWAAGGGEGRIARYASGVGLKGLGVKEVRQRLRREFVPANAVLSIAGNLATVRARELVRNEFGSIPAGEPLPPGPPARLDSASCVVARPGIPQPTGVLGVLAPALADSSHPAFLMQLLVIGGHCRKRWGPPGPPLTSRFQYSVLDDPEIVRFYPPVAPTDTLPAALASELINTLTVIGSMIIPPSVYQAVWIGVDWLLGGPMPRDIEQRILTDGGALHSLGSGMATRELWGGEPFWSEYRRRFREAIENPYVGWYDALVTPTHQVRMLFVPQQ